MGQGEPFLNFSEVTSAIRIINDKGQIVKTIQCNNGTTEANIKLGSLLSLLN
mgnify:CR=1 FL=1